MAVAMALIAAGTVVSAFGSFSSGRAARRAAREQERRLQEAAAYARAAAGFESRRQAERDARTLGAFRLAVAKAGVRLEGSPLVVYGAQVRQAEQNRLAILFEGDLRARGLEAQARITHLEGQQAATAGRLEAVTGLIGGAYKLTTVTG